jgi:tetratricopeptide (TPR) repeat protein
VNDSRLLIVGGSREARLSAAATQVAQIASSSDLVELRAPLLPFRRPSLPFKPSTKRHITLLINDLEKAFPDRQAGGLRLVLTQSTYLLQKWLDIAGPKSRVVLTADLPSLLLGAPEIDRCRGPWRHFDVLDLDDPSGAVARTEVSVMDVFAVEPTQPVAEPSSIEQLLIQAFNAEATEERLRLCEEASQADRKSEVAALALASACREAGDSTTARRAFERAHTLAPRWEAAYYEDGKFWLACEDMDRASAAFRRAAELMPTFSAAWSNLGATLGELGRSQEALQAFREALKHDPKSYSILNNIGVVTRELGRLKESEDALRQVVALAPDYIFGHYNLGHTRFLRRDFQGALASYEEGQRLDPQKNRRQGCRLAIVRLANGDVEGAERDLWHFADQAPPEEREDLLLEAYEIGQALLTRAPEIKAHRLFLERIATALSP